MKEVSVQQADFDVGAEIATLSADDIGAGAVASFVGLVRADKLSDEKVGAGETASVYAMTLEHYPAMTEQALEETFTTQGPAGSFMLPEVVHHVVRRGFQEKLPPVAHHLKESGYFDQRIILTGQVSRGAAPAPGRRETA